MGGLLPGLTWAWGPWRPGAERTLICHRWSEWFNIRPLMDSERRMSRPRTGFPRRTSRLSRAGDGPADGRGPRVSRPGTAAAAAGPAPAAGPVPAAGVDLAAVLGPVRSQNAFEETVERLLAVIKLGVVGPGERFPAERELAAMLGVSRITLREAIGDLRAAGYVESRRGRFGGTFVTYTPPAPSRVELRRIAVEDADKINDALTFRMAVETGAAQILAQAGARPGGTRGPPRSGSVTCCWPGSPR